MREILSKEKFVEAINAMRDWWDKTNKLYEDFGIDTIEMKIPHLEETILNILVDIFDDYENDWISWWCYDTEFGKNEDLTTIYDRSGEVAIAELKTAEDLYDYLVKECNKWLN